MIEEDKIYFARTPYGQEEIDATVKCLEEGWVGPGKYTDEFESKVSLTLGKKYGVMVNSGSSALLLVSAILDIKKGDEIITCATGFPTTINPFIERGATIVLVDTVPETLSPDYDKIEEAITDRTRAIILAHIFGATLDMKRLRAIADKHGILFIEDSCDSLGATIDGLPVGEYSDISVTSFYASHIITAAGGGGMICLNDLELANKARLLRDWGRYEATEAMSRFDSEIDGIPYDGKFVYDALGYNLKATEVQAAFGLVQLSKLDELNKVRRFNHGALSQVVGKYGLTPVNGVGEPSWLTFPFLVKNATERKRLVLFLESNNVQTRPILAGNFMRHPVYKDKNIRHGDLSGADEVARRGVGIGLHSEITTLDIQKIDDLLGVFYA